LSLDASSSAFSAAPESGRLLVGPLCGHDLLIYRFGVCQ